MMIDTISVTSESSSHLRLSDNLPSSVYLVHDHREIMKYHAKYHTMLLLQDIIPLGTALNIAKDQGRVSSGSVVSLVSVVDINTANDEPTRFESEEEDDDEMTLAEEEENSQLLKVMHYPFNYQIMVKGKDLIRLNESATLRLDSSLFEEKTFRLTLNSIDQSSHSNQTLEMNFSRKTTMRKWQKKLLEITLDLLLMSELRNLYLCLSSDQFEITDYYLSFRSISNTLSRIRTLFEVNYSSDGAMEESSRKFTTYLASFLRHHYFLAIYLDVAQIVYELFRVARRKFQGETGIADFVRGHSLTGLGMSSCDIIETIAELRLSDFFKHHRYYLLILQDTSHTVGNQQSTQQDEKKAGEMDDRERLEIEEAFLQNVTLFLQLYHREARLDSRSVSKDEWEGEKRQSIRSFYLKRSQSDLSTATSSIDGTASSLSCGKTNPSSFASLVSAIQTSKALKNNTATTVLTLGREIPPLGERKGSHHRVIRFQGMEIQSGHAVEDASVASVLSSQITTPDRSIVTPAAEATNNLISGKACGGEGTSSNVNRRFVFPEEIVGNLPGSSVHQNQPLLSPLTDPASSPLNTAFLSGTMSHTEGPTCSDNIHSNEEELKSGPSPLSIFDLAGEIKIKQASSLPSRQKATNMVDETRPSSGDSRDVEMFHQLQVPWNRFTVLKILVIVVSATLLVINSIKAGYRPLTPTTSSSPSHHHSETFIGTVNNSNHLLSLQNDSLLASIRPEANKDERIERYFRPDIIEDSELKIENISRDIEEDSLSDSQSSIVLALPAQDESNRAHADSVPPTLEVTVIVSQGNSSSGRPRSIKPTTSTISNWLRGILHKLHSWEIRLKKLLTNLRFW